MNYPVRQNDFDQYVHARLGMNMTNGGLSGENLWLWAQSVWPNITLARFYRKLSVAYQNLGPQGRGLIKRSGEAGAYIYHARRAFPQANKFIKELARKVQGK